MFDPRNIEATEARLHAAGRTVADLCRAANIAQTTWGRWKRGDFLPSYRKAQKVDDALNKIAPPQAQQEAS